MCLTGTWRIYEREMLSLLQAQLKTLKCIVLSGTCLIDRQFGRFGAYGEWADVDGDWNNILHHVVTEDHTALRYFYLNPSWNFSYKWWDAEANLDPTILDRITFGFEVGDEPLRFGRIDYIESEGEY